MIARYGMDAKLYRNTATTYDTPTWSEIKGVRDLTLNLEKGEADVTTRGSAGWKAAIGTAIDVSIEFDLLWDPTDTDFAALNDAFFSRANVDCAVLDGAYNVAGSQGVRATFTVLKFTRNEPRDDVLTASVTMKPTYAEHPPQKMVVPTLP